MGDEQRRTLHDLVDDDDIDALLLRVSLDDIAEAWCRYNAAEHDSDEEAWEDPDWWAIELLFGGAFYRDADLIRSILIKLVEHANSDQLGAIGAGPLENFVSDDEDDLRWIETQCASNEGFRVALSGVWCASSVSTATMERLDAAAGVRLSRPMPREEWPPELIAVRDAETRLLGIAGADWGVAESPTADQLAVQQAYLDALVQMMEVHNPGAFEAFKQAMDDFEADE